MRIFTYSMVITVTFHLQHGYNCKSIHGYHLDLRQPPSIWQTCSSSSVFDPLEQPRSLFWTHLSSETEILFYHEIPGLLILCGGDTTTTGIVTIPPRSPFGPRSWIWIYIQEWKLWCIIVISIVYQMNWGQISKNSILNISNNMRDISTKKYFNMEYFPQEDFQLTAGEIFSSAGSWDTAASHHWTAAEKECFVC